MARPQYTLPQWEQTILEQAHDSATVIWTAEQLKALEGIGQVHALILQLDGTVTMSGGNFAEADFDAIAKSIGSLSLELPGVHKIYDEISGDELAGQMRMMGVFGLDWFVFVVPDGAAPTDTNSETFRLYVVLMGPDCWYEGGARYHNWPAEVLRYLRISLTTGADTAVDANCSISGTWRVKAFGSLGGDKILAPLPKYERFENTTQVLDLYDPDEVIRGLYAYDASGFAAHATETDVLKINNKVFWPDQGHTVGELLEKMELRRTIQAAGYLDRDASTGAKTGLTATTYPMSAYLEYISPRCDLGDSPFHMAKDVTLKPGSSRDVRRFSYRKIDGSLLAQIQRLCQKDLGSIGNVEKVGFGPGQFSAPVDVGALSTVLPVRIGSR